MSIHVNAEEVFEESEQWRVVQCAVGHFVTVCKVPLFERDGEPHGKPVLVHVVIGGST